MLVYKSKCETNANNERTHRMCYNRVIYPGICLYIFHNRRIVEYQLCSYDYDDDFRKRKKKKKKKNDSPAAFSHTSILYSIYKLYSHLAILESLSTDRKLFILRFSFPSCQGKTSHSQENDFAEVTFYRFQFKMYSNFATALHCFRIVPREIAMPRLVENICSDCFCIL